MSRSGGLRCDPEGVFELAEGEISPGRERELRAHLDGCPGCRELYAEELNLNACLGEFEAGETRSVCREVAMSLPTRSVAVRLVWVGLAGGLLIATVLALGLDGTNPAAFAIEVLGAFWGFVSGLSDATEALLVALGPMLLLALALGAVLDLLIAGAVFSLSRRRAREA